MNFSNQQDLDALDDMQNAARDLAQKIGARASDAALSAECRALLRRWAVKINDDATRFALDYA